MEDLGQLEARIADLRARAAGGTPDAQLAQEVDEILSAGYAAALRLDAESARLRERIGELVSQVEDSRAAWELRRLNLEEGAVTARALRLRSELGALRDLVAPNR